MRQSSTTDTMTNHGSTESSTMGGGQPVLVERRHEVVAPLMTSSSLGWVLAELSDVQDAILRSHSNGDWNAVGEPLNLASEKLRNLQQVDISNTPSGKHEDEIDVMTGFSYALSGSTVEPSSPSSTSSNLTAANKPNEGIMSNIEATRSILAAKCSTLSAGEKDKNAFFDVAACREAAKFVDMISHRTTASVKSKVVRDEGVDDHSQPQKQNQFPASKGLLSSARSSSEDINQVERSESAGVSPKSKVALRLRSLRDIVLAPELLVPPDGVGAVDATAGAAAGFAAKGPFGPWLDPTNSGAAGAAGGGEWRGGRESRRDASKPQLERADSRRHSADCQELKAEFDRRVRQNRTMQRRRKSVDDHTLALVALHAHEMQGFREFQTPHSASSMGVLRSNSSQGVTGKFLRPLSPDDGGGRNKQGVGALLGKQKSLCGFTGSAMAHAWPAWPANITTMLTSGQSLRDRLHLFRQLEKLLTPPIPCTSTPASAACYGGISSSPGTHLHLPLGSSPAAVALSPRRHASVAVPPRRTAGLRLVSGAYSIPRPDKPLRGEDAHFCADDAGVVGIADGVGEWCELGCNPRQFAEEFMQGCQRTAERLHRERVESQRASPSSDPKQPMPASAAAMQMLQEGYESTVSFGSSTALVAGLDSEGKTLGVANLGDSALVVLRRESRRHRHFTVCRRTKEQQHFFNCPYQISRVPQKSDVADLEKKGMHRLIRVLHNLQSTFEGDSPNMADLYDIKLQEGDLVIIATDGLLDNLFDREVASLVSLCLSPYEAHILGQAGLHDAAQSAGSFPHPDSILLPECHPHFGFATAPASLARAVAEAAFFRSLDPTVKTPFANQSRRAGGFFSGGKMDDITVVAVWVV